MDIKGEVGIVSVFGRGHWLAAALAQAKVPVKLLDVSQQMGVWAPEDAEGPFGFFETEGLEKERLSSDEKVIPVDRGLTLWLSSGPLELHGPTTSYRVSQLQIPEAVVQYVRGESQEKVKDPLKGFSFKDSWLAQISHAMTSTVDTLSPEASKEGMRRNLFSPFLIRESTVQGLEKSLKWCEAQGVEVLRHVEVKDLAFRDKQTLGSLEIRQDKPRLFSAEQYVFCLTAEEAGMLSQKVQHVLFGSRILEPEWAWVRYRIQLKERRPLSEMTRHQIPAHCVVIEDLMLPWSHENFVILRRRTGPSDEFDAWMKIPNNQRFQSQYLQERGLKMKAFIEARLPDNEMEILDLPKEASSTFQQVGPARHPIFSRALRSLRTSDQMGNISFDSPEYWKALSWEGQFEHQRQIFQRLKSWWDRKEELRLKREAKEAAKRRNQGADL